MSKPTREPGGSHQDATYHVSTQAWNRTFILQSERMATLVIETLYWYRSQHKFLLHAFVVMPNHLHVLITPHEDITLERAAQFIKGGFSHRAKAELGFASEVWQRGFADHRIRDFDDYNRHVDYIHLNPVRDGKVTRAADFPFSSAHPGFELDDYPQRLKPESVESTVRHA